MLKITDLSKKFGQLQILKGISLEIPENCTFALLGPNGSGKSTLLKSLIGSVHFDEGKIELNGYKNVKEPEYKTNLVYMPQSPVFLPHLTTREIITLLIQLRKQPAVMAERLIKELEIEKFWKKPFRELSGGMKQKINILQCFMFDFKIAFLDEPTASLDPHVAWYLKSLIKELKNKGNTIVFTSHIMSEIEEIADHLAVIHNGEIILVTRPSRFISEQRAQNLEEAMLSFWQKGAIKTYEKIS